VKKFKAREWHQLLGSKTIGMTVYIHSEANVRAVIVQCALELKEGVFPFVVRISGAYRSVPILPDDEILIDEKELLKHGFVVCENEKEMEEFAKEHVEPNKIDFSKRLEETKDKEFNQTDVDIEIWELTKDEE